MKLPTGIVTKNKIRDSKICSLFATDAWTYEEIATRFGISATRVGQIIYKNRALLVLDQQHEKIKRVNTLKRMLKKHPSNIGNKTTLDIVDSLRNEAEGKNGSTNVGHSDSRVIIIREVPAQIDSAPNALPTNRIAGVIDGSPDQTGTVPGSVSIVRV